MKGHCICRAASTLAVAILLAMVSVAHAATTYYWTDGIADWTTAADWSPSTAYPISRRHRLYRQ